MTQQAENVKDVVTVVSQGEGVNDCVEADSQQGASDEKNEHEDAGEQCSALKK